MLWLERSLINDGPGSSPAIGSFASFIFLIFNFLDFCFSRFLRAERKRPHSSADYINRQSSFKNHLAKTLQVSDSGNDLSFHDFANLGRGPQFESRSGT